MKLTVILILLFLALVRNAQAAEQALNLQDPTFVVQAYMRATYARDFIEAYRYISAEDRRVRNLNRYVQQRGAYYGFALDATKKLAEFGEVKAATKLQSPNRVQAVAWFKAPDLSRVSSLLFNWNTYQLNSLPATDRVRLIDALEKKRREGSLEMVEGEETLDLVKEGNEWRIFLNWAAGIKIPLRLQLSNTSELEVALSTNEVVAQPGEPFEIFLKIKNRSNRQMIARIGHLVEPRAVADYLDFVECGFLLPVTLEPGKEQEYSGRYLLRGNIPEGVHQLSLTYDFRSLK